MLMTTLTVFMTLMTDLPDPQATRLAEITAESTVACYGVAAGRRSTPIRENYLTFSDVVGELKRGVFMLGERVPGENKVLVLTPTAAGPIGIARFTFLKQVDKAKCTGSALYAPAFDTLMGWGEPLPGVAPLPRQKKADPTLHQGCYQAKAGAILRDVAHVQRLPPGMLLWGGDALEGKGVSATLQVLDPISGHAFATVARSKVERVPLSRCAGL